MISAFIPVKVVWMALILCVRLANHHSILWLRVMALVSCVVLLTVNSVPLRIP